MEYENLAQNIESRNHYLDTQYDISFFHDFSEYKALDKQIDSVKEKYARRIDSFLKNIEKPTLFFRYISNERKNENGKSIELQWIEENQDYINRILQSYNPQNRVIYIGDEETQSSIVKIYHVKVDDNDWVSRSPIIHNEELYSVVQNFKIPQQYENKKRYEKKERKNRSLYMRVKRKIISLYHKTFCKIYIHSKEYNTSNGQN